MKNKLPWILTLVLTTALVAVVVARPQKTAAAPARKVLYWVDPMHPSYKSAKPGKAPDCGMDLVPVYEKSAVTSTPSGYANVKMPIERRQLIGVQTGMAERRPIGRSIRTVGRVAVDETRLHKITIKFDGYIERLYANFTGKEVRRGEALFSVYSPDLLATQQEYLLALRARQQAPALVDAARQRLRLWDISDRDIRELERSGSVRKSLVISSPASGYILNKTAVEGMRVAAGETLFDIASLDRLWIVADVYESELPFVRAGATATITLSYIPGRTWSGRVSFINPLVDPTTRTVKVRVELDNRDGALKPDMFADVVIEQPQREAVVVPESAVLTTGERAIVFVVKEDGTLEPREVRSGTKSAQSIEIVSGIEPGEKVVTQANFLIDSESRLKAALAQMTPQGHHHD